MEESLPLTRWTVFASVKKLDLSIRNRPDQNEDPQKLMAW